MVTNSLSANEAEISAKLEDETTHLAVEGHYMMIGSNVDTSTNYNQCDDAFNKSSLNVR